MKTKAKVKTCYKCTGKGYVVTGYYCNEKFTEKCGKCKGTGKLYR